MTTYRQLEPPDTLSLEKLLDEVLREVRERQRKSCRYQWEAKRTLALVHIDELGNKSPLGVFHELHCARDKSARRLVPTTDSENDPDIPVEFVRGALWTTPQIRTDDRILSPSDLSDMRARFWELLRELESDAPQA